jgi:DNA polymerase III alpha subunit
MKNNKLIKINTLTMTKNNINRYIVPELLDSSNSDIQKLFVRKIPSNLPVYRERLEYELNLLNRKNLISHLIQAIQILNITKNIPHVTRGSCGSSLVCYLLGISHIDPILNNIKFSRFLNEYRNNLPDIDLDFPHNLRDEVFLKIELQWPGKVARISNHVYYHEKSALRQAIRNAGIRKFIGKNDINKELKGLSKETQQFINLEKNKLDNTFKCYSLHCGGIVYYPSGVPEEILINSSSSSLKQINMNKHEVAKDKNFKIDILSSRGLSQLYEINKYSLKGIEFEEFVYDKKTFDMLHRGDNIGITLAESPLMRIAFMKFKPVSLHDLAVCLSIIRPAASDARNVEEIVDDLIIFDDDAIDIISKECNVCEEDADKYRRAFAKGDKVGISEFKKQIEYLSKDKQKNIMKKMSNLSA